MTSTSWRQRQDASKQPHDPEPCWQTEAVKVAIRNGKLQVIGFRQAHGFLDVLTDKHGQTLGTYNRQSKVTRDRQGKIVGYHVDQLMRLL